MPRSVFPHLATGSDPFDGDSGRLLCHFSEPAAGEARVHVDTALGFVRGPVLVALQFVDLREQQASRTRISSSPI